MISHLEQSRGGGCLVREGEDKENLLGHAKLSASFHPSAWASTEKPGTWYSGCNVFYCGANMEKGSFKKGAEEQDAAARTEMHPEKS